MTAFGDTFEKTWGQQGSKVNLTPSITTCDSTLVTADNSMAITVDLVDTNIRAEFNSMNDDFTALYNLLIH